MPMYTLTGQYLVPDDRSLPIKVVDTIRPIIWVPVVLLSTVLGLMSLASVGVMATVWWAFTVPLFLLGVLKWGVLRYARGVEEKIDSDESLKAKIRLRVSPFSWIR